MIYPVESAAMQGDDINKASIPYRLSNGVDRDMTNRSLERRRSIRGWERERRWGVSISLIEEMWGMEWGISYFKVSNAKGSTDNRIVKGGEP